MTDHKELKLILSFLKEIGIAVIERELSESTFLPGLSLGPNCIYVDYSRLLYPGDLLHEAGHLAVTTSEQRNQIGTTAADANWPTDGEEIGAILWSYAALKHIGIPAQIVFHENGYKNDSQWLIDNFSNGIYIGLPFLEWIGIALGKERAEKEGKSEFPLVLKWIRD
ncbi:hypothetical protein ABDJ41_02235 [Pedobacter sp. ASV1-7]|uniref:hypothetical protein n=1 Tax=Pedobacter sp. ASV1-7 TaxID=3145237 RepID=UPI0032E91781